MAMLRWCLILCLMPFTFYVKCCVCWCCYCHCHCLLLQYFAYTSCSTAHTHLFIVTFIVCYSLFEPIYTVYMNTSHNFCVFINIENQWNYIRIKLSLTTEWIRNMTFIQRTLIPIDIHSGQNGKWNRNFKVEMAKRSTPNRCNRNEWASERI